MTTVAESRIPITCAAEQITVGSLPTYAQVRIDSRGGPMFDSDTGERVTPVLDFPSRDGLAVQAIRVDYEPGGFTNGTHRHPAGAYVYVIEGSVIFGLDDRAPVVLKAGESFYEPPGALHSVSRNASEDLPASLIAFFVLGERECATVYDRD
jgi:quercetin dioxygenase-like cupin family protein